MAESDAEEKDRSDIKVTDRRMFTREGVLRDDAGGAAEADEREEEPNQAPPAEGTEPTAEAAPPANEARPGGDAGFEHRPVEEPEGVDFTMLINAMAQPALIFLGELAHPGTGKPEVNFEQARLQIDLLHLLRIKCRGNMTADEEGLLDQILYQLRMLYVSRSSPPASGAGEGP